MATAVPAIKRAIKAKEDEYYSFRNKHSSHRRTPTPPPRYPNEKYYQLELAKYNQEIQLTTRLIFQTDNENQQVFDNEESLNQFQILHGQLETLKQNLKAVTEAEYKAAMAPKTKTPKPEKAVVIAKPQAKANKQPTKKELIKKLEISPEPKALEIASIMKAKYGGGDRRPSKDERFLDMCDKIPQWINEHHFKAIDDKTIYRYSNGVYIEDGINLIQGLVEIEMGDENDNGITREAIGKIARLTFTDRAEFNKPRFLNCKNGLYELETGVFVPHTPENLSTIQLPVIYDPQAMPDATWKFLAEVLEQDDKHDDFKLVQELLGWLLWPEYNVHKAFMLVGSGRNGKGTLLRLMQAMLGKANVSNVSLQQLCDNRFMAAQLYGKLANLGGDLPAIDISDTATFKGLTGGDMVEVERKFGHPFGFDNIAKLGFSANKLPKTPDETYAFYSRWLIIEFKHVFDVQAGTGDEDLDAKLQTPEELSGLLNLALHGLQRLRENNWKFSYSKTVEDVEVMYKRLSEPVVAFLMDECIEDSDPNAFVYKSDLYSAYKRYELKNHLKPSSPKRFWMAMKEQSEIACADYRPDKFGEWAVKGLRVKGLKPEVAALNLATT